MGFEIVPRYPGDDGDIRLRLGHRVERKRQLHPGVVAGAEGSFQHLFNVRHHRGMPRELRGHLQDLAVDQLDPVVLVEKPVVDHAVVFRPGPPARVDVARLCRVHKASPGRVWHSPTARFVTTSRSL
jgi:hypothetical protein